MVIDRDEPIFRLTNQSHEASFTLTHTSFQDLEDCNITLIAASATITLPSTPYSFVVYKDGAIVNAIDGFNFDYVVIFRNELLAVREHRMQEACIAGYEGRIEVCVSHDRERDRFVLSGSVTNSYSADWKDWIAEAKKMAKIHDFDHQYVMQYRFDISEDSLEASIRDLESYVERMRE